MEVEKYVDSPENEIYLDTVSRIDSPKVADLTTKVMMINLKKGTPSSGKPMI